jgi:hypothetical protein
MTAPDPRVKCRDCAHWNPRKCSTELASLGFGHCAPLSRGTWHTFSGTFKHLCASFQRAPEETIEARERFAAAQQPRPQPESTR